VQVVDQNGDLTTYAGVHYFTFARGTGENDDVTFEFVVTGSK
jgi:hypothetical protein